MAATDSEARCWRCDGAFLRCNAARLVPRREGRARHIRCGGSSLKVPGKIWWLLMVKERRGSIRFPTVFAPLLSLSGFVQERATNEIVNVGKEKGRKHQRPQTLESLVFSLHQKLV